MRYFTLIKQAFLGLVLALSSPAFAQEASKALLSASDDAFAIIDTRRIAFEEKHGWLKFGYTFEPANGRLKVTFRDGTIAYPKADLINSYNLKSKRMTWGWAQSTGYELSTELSEKLRDQAEVLGFPELRSPTLDLPRPADAHGLSAMGVHVGEPQFLQHFELGGTIHYVLLTFDGGEP